ncbi:pyruvate dehydrogenase E2 component (dihydrolipoamide acetyltransferase) [Oryzisolibacter propanilivorax]|uniref:Acetyltransferase component of pyruvate dehydrogenase complex n=1 Tax=Oryzisolibacter propanilivorax TaxID=1527607 RepID=A0A1G9SRL8_9BURK|nr:dihydrolipoyllysine-residue acetyltransferase [Oryzisolibacter propanilivorax]SDM38109.1 pyruvate dehydrogenase E2 component (dihydrolipoamide acetyltransferase) [Oryzisolibacter propanilivorax]
MALVDIKVPDIGDFDEVGVIELLVAPGDKVRVEQSLITVESDKASMEIPSDQAGTIKELKVQLGDKVKQGTVIAVLETEGAAASEAKPAPAPTAQAPAAPEKEASPAPAAAQAPAPAAAPAAAEMIEVRVPDIGDFADVAVIEMLVAVGATVTLEQSLITVESDKASMEIPSSAEGVVKEIRVAIGDKLNKGDLVAIVEGQRERSAAPAAQVQSPQVSPPAAAAAPQAATAAAPVAAPASAPAAQPAHQPGTPAPGLPHASPSVRKFARELGVPLAEVKGSGPKGRITQEDIQSFTRSVMSGSVQTQAQAASAPKGAAGGGAGLDLLPWPKVDFAKFGPVERKDLSRIKKLSGANLSRNWVMIPHVTNNDEADITELEAFRVQTNKEGEKAKSAVKVTMLAFVIKAVVAALKKYPEFNASLDGDALVYKQYFHIGFAADTPNGLVVPVLKDADKKGILQISEEMGELAKKARDGKLSGADMQGGCFTISSLGGIGGTHFTPIINAPEVAILGLSRGAMKPVWDGKQFVPRLMLPLSLSYDHRVIDGAAAARFNAFLGQVLADYRRIVL